jgi:hypothetical protein
MQRVQEMLRPYTVQDFISDGNPVDYKDLQRLEKIWDSYHNRRLFNNCY